MARRSYPHVTKGIRYAREVASGKRASGKYAKLACERFLRDLERAKSEDCEFLFDRAKANRVCKFMENMPHTKGVWAQQGGSIKLEPWQCFFFIAVFGFVYEDGTRRFTEAYLRVARKNGKSIKAAGLGLYMLVEDGEFGAEVYSGATSRKQALEVFTPAKRMCELHPDLSYLYDIEVNSSNLSIPSIGSKFEPIIGRPGDGASPSCAIIDEYHEHRSSDLYETMVTGMAAREQPLTLIITTAGVDIGGPCFEKDDDVKKILEGAYEDDSVFGLIYAADEEIPWDSKQAMKQANPNLGVSVSERYLQRRIEAARRSPDQLAFYKTKHLNQWVGAGTTFLNMIEWRNCAGEVDVEKLRGKDCIMGVDLSSRIDITAIVKLWFEKGDDDNLFYWLLPEFFIPENRLRDDKSGRYKTWVEQGHLQIHEGDEIDYAELRKTVKQEWEDLMPSEVAYDPWKSIGLEQELSNEGVIMVKIAQTVAQFTSPLDELEAAHLSKRIVHNDNPVLNWMMSNLVVRTDTNGNKKPRREIEKNKIDGAVATLMAINRAMAQNHGGFVSGGLRVI